MSARSPLSPYAAHLLVNSMRARRGTDGADVRPQMFYGYAKRGVITASCATHGSGSHKDGACVDSVFDGDAFYAWLQRYFSGERTVQTKVNVAALAAEFDLDPETTIEAVKALASTE